MNRNEKLRISSEIEEEFIQNARKDLLAFIMHIKEDYQVNWHHRYLCKKLNDFVSGKIKRLLVLMPPRHGKSEIVSRNLPAFLMGLNPSVNIIATSYSSELASRMNRDVQRVIDNPRYQQVFTQTRLNSKNIKTMGSWLRNSDIFEVVGYGGTYRCAGVGGGITGMGGNFIIIDDPIKNKEEADSPVYRQKLWDWYGSTLYTRLEKDAAILLTVTRWHEDDLAGRLIEKQKKDPESDQWEIVNFAAICERKQEADPRELGEALWPHKYNLQRLQGIRTSIGLQAFTALYQQNPTPLEGNIIKRAYFKFYDEPPEEFDTVIQAWDGTFDKTATSDFVCGVLLGKKGANIYLLPDMEHDRMGFMSWIKAMLNFTARHPEATAKYVEKAANGAALIDVLKEKVHGLIPIIPKGSKLARVNSISPVFEAGNFWLPDPKKYPWVEKVIEEFVTFPTAPHDDIVDAVTHGIMKLIDKKQKQDFTAISIPQINYWQ